jgi:hypothetical protein
MRMIAWAAIEQYQTDELLVKHNVGMEMVTAGKL